jgi:hypothetical protein
MNLQDYLKLSYLLQNDPTNKEQKRAFALKHNLQELPKKKQLLFWMQHHSDIQEKKEPLKTITKILLFISFVCGFVSAVALLSYSGAKPVNVVYFFTIAVLIPLVSIFFSLFGLFFPKLFAPLFFTTWMQQLLSKFFKGESPLIQMPSQLKYRYILFIVQQNALLFSIGLFLGFLALIFTQDIAFAWSSTIAISAESFYHFLHTLAFAFEPFCPQSVVSLELIEKSHYFRLGEHISPLMQQNAALFGEWWRFLACSTLFYAIFLRLVLLLASYLQFQKSLKNAFLQTPGAAKLLRAMNEPIISTQAHDQEQTLPTQKHSLPKEDHKEHYYALLGWAYSKEELLLCSDTLNIHADKIESVGGNKTLQEESAIIAQMQESVLLLTKAWEVPTMEFIDFIEDLQANTSQITIYPLGYAKENYQPRVEDVTVWEAKIATQNFQKVRIKV